MRSHATLTTTEQRVLRALLSGGTNADIADDLDVSAATVKGHLDAARDKLGARNRAEAAARAVLLLEDRPSERPAEEEVAPW